MDYGMWCVAASLICIVSHIFVFVLIFISPVESARASESFVFCALRCIICVLHTFRGALPHTQTHTQLPLHLSLSLCGVSVCCALHFRHIKYAKQCKLSRWPAETLPRPEKLILFFGCKARISCLPDFRLHFWLLILWQHCRHRHRRCRRRGPVAIVFFFFCSIFVFLFVLINFFFCFRLFSAN